MLLLPILTVQRNKNFIRLIVSAYHLLFTFGLTN